MVVLLGVLGLDVGRTPRWEERRPQMERRADAILSRFPEGTRFYSNTGWKGDRPDFYEQGVRGLDLFSNEPSRRQAADAGGLTTLRQARTGYPCRFLSPTGGDWIR
ncbi:hypothetical protein ABT024_28580 [Streptomyces sp. NPDC002812]|uniref:hypothetical protein n=1 Tax=Streptomyces sp. NPDC002812 TaxID=3154434 RepID=UPI00332114AE